MVESVVFGFLDAFRCFHDCPGVESELQSHHIALDLQARLFHLIIVSAQPQQPSHSLRLVRRPRLLPPTLHHRLTTLTTPRLNLDKCLIRPRTRLNPTRRIDLISSRTTLPTIPFRRELDPSADPLTDRHKFLGFLVRGEEE